MDRSLNFDIWSAATSARNALKPFCDSLYTSNEIHKMMRSLSLLDAPCLVIYTKIRSWFTQQSSVQVYSLAKICKVDFIKTSQTTHASRLVVENDTRNSVYPLRSIWILLWRKSFGCPKSSSLKSETEIGARDVRSGWVQLGDGTYARRGWEEGPVNWFDECRVVNYPSSCFCQLSGCFCRCSTNFTRLLRIQVAAFSCVLHVHVAQWRR